MFTFNCNGRIMEIDKPIVMGIINVSPDSFYKESTANSIDEILHLAEKMLQEGATILDIGGQSTKPGSNDVGIKEQLVRVIPAIKAISARYPECFISIDTFHAKVAAAAVDAGAIMVNDISAGSLDDKMIKTVASLKVPYVVMHMKGTPATMQQHTHYEDMLLDILEFFIQKTNECVKAGIKDIIIDPGFGFAKNIDQNFKLLKNLSIFKILQKPMLAGLSRKSSIYKTLGILPEEAKNGTTVLNTLAIQNGANILRVHDVKEAMETIQLLKAYATS